MHLSPLLAALIAPLLGPLVAAPDTAGDLVTVYLSHDLRAADGSLLRAAGYSFQFMTRAE